MHQTLTVAPSPTTLTPLTSRGSDSQPPSHTNNSLSGNLAKSFVRLNTENKPRSVERQRPILSKAQSMATPSYTMAMTTPTAHLNQKNDQQTTGSPQLDYRNNNSECNGNNSKYKSFFFLIFFIKLLF